MATKKPKSKSNKTKTEKLQTADTTELEATEVTAVESPETETTEVSETEVVETILDEDSDDDEATQASEDSAEEENKDESDSDDNEEDEETKSEELEDAVTKAAISSDSNKSCLSGFFSKKYAEKESILTIFKNHKFYGALVGELLGTAFITLLLFAVSLMGIASIATYGVALVAIFIGIYAFSGACLNPIVTVGMMASRRMSVIRGIMYIIAEIIGAWLGWLIFNSFHLAGGETAYDVPAMSAIGEGQFWIIAMVELMGAIIIAFFFARALKYKRSVFTFAVTITGGMILAVVMGYVVSAAFLGLSSNFIFNPASALMFQIFPTSGDDFGQIMGGICQALSIYALLPMIGGVVGFYLSDFTALLSSDDE